MKTFNKVLPLLFLVAVLLTTACSKNDSAPQYLPQAALRMVNAYSASESILFTENNNYLNSPYAPLKYSEYTSNLALLFPGNKRLRVYNNENEVISDTTVNLKDSTYYTSFVFGNTSEAKNLIATDIRLTNLNNENIGLRFLHLASNLENVNVYFDKIETPIYQNRAPEQILIPNGSNSSTLFKEQAKGKKKIIITDQNQNLILEKEYDFNHSGYYSIVLIGDKNSTTKPLYIGIIKQ